VTLFHTSYVISPKEKEKEKENINNDLAILSSHDSYLLICSIAWPILIALRRD